MAGSKCGDCAHVDDSFRCSSFIDEGQPTCISGEIGDANDFDCGS